MLSSRLSISSASLMMTRRAAAATKSKFLSTAAASSSVLMMNQQIPSSSSMKYFSYNNSHHHHSSCSSSCSSSSSLFKTTRPLLQASDPHSEEPKKQDNFALPSWTDPNAKNLYTRLGLRSSATTNDIKKHYRHLAKQYHPDNNAGNKEAEDKFRNVKEAYETLSNTDKRRVYDSTGASASQQEQAGFGGGARQYQWSGTGVHGKYNVRFDENGRPVFEVSRWVWFIFFFSIGLFIQAFRELRNRKKSKEIPDDASREHELGVQRSGLWRPLVSIVLFMTFLPRLPACILTWYFYVYRPTIQAEDRATMDNVTIIVKDEFEGAAVKLSLVSPFLEQALKKVKAKASDAEDYIMTVTLRPYNNNSNSAIAPATTSSNDSSNDNNKNENENNNNNSLPTVEYPCGDVNFYTMSFPRPRTQDGKTILPCTATVRVKTVVREGEQQKVNPEKGNTIFERQMTIV